jgi:putative peptidoglycan lipid II flippase
MAVGTLLSRVTGLLRTLATVYAVGFLAVSGDYNLANTIPNMVHDLVLGGILSATFVPVFVERLASRSEDEAWEAISAVVSVTLVAIGVASVLFLLAAPAVTSVLTSLDHGAQRGADRRLATDLLVLFVPQLACYGVISLATAVLNARRRFAAPAFVPIVNNVVLIVVLVAFRQVVGPLVVGSPAGAAAILAHRSWLLLLGIGTTAGVVLQAAALVPALRAAHLQLRWRPRFGHDAVRTVVRLSGWTVGVVVANQVALTVVLLVSEAIGPQAVSAYSYAWQFFQLPFGVVAVSIMSTTAPELAHQWTVGDLVGFRHRLAVGLRAMVVVVVPAAAGMLVLAHPALELLGRLTHQADADETAQSLAVLALGLPGFSVFLYAVRALQSMQDMRTTFWLYLVENTVNVVLAVALYHPLGVRGVAASISAAYTAAAVVAVVHVGVRTGGWDTAALVGPLRRTAVATAVLVVGAAAGESVVGGRSAGALAAQLVLGGVVGGAGYLVTVALGSRLTRPARGPNRPVGPEAVVPPPRPPAAGRPPHRPDRLGPLRRPPSGGHPPP